MPTDQLVPYIRNARTHSAVQVAQIAASIAEFGFTNPILIGEDGVIIAGHGRMMAAQSLGLPDVPVIVLDHLSDAQRRALVLADNRIAENAGWDNDMLASELAALREDDFDLDLIGFDDASLTSCWRVSGLAALRQTQAGTAMWPRGPAVPRLLSQQMAVSPSGSAFRRSRSSMPARDGGRIASAHGRTSASGPNLGAAKATGPAPAAARCRATAHGKTTSRGLPRPSTMARFSGRVGWPIRWQRPQPPVGQKRKR